MNTFDIIKLILEFLTLGMCFSTFVLLCKFKRVEKLVQACMQKCDEIMDAYLDQYYTEDDDGALYNAKIEESDEYKSALSELEETQKSTGYYSLRKRFKIFATITFCLLCTTIYVVSKAIGL